MKLKILMIFLLSALLSGCIALVAAGTAGGLIVYDHRNVVTIEKDTRIFHRIHTKFVRMPEFEGSHINVTSFNQLVLLVGQVPSPELKARAENIAQHTPNVLHVYNELEVSDATALSHRSKDGIITSQVRTQMLLKKGLASGSIRVVTENRVVYLMGITTREQGALAADVARKVNGVNKVVKVFRYIA